ncbi:M20/M25/M40 family metallo-hydrolase [Puia sp.]|jgi:hypothetical protein|uniref:M20/M25/M40 family metallo-hydrolase n=1 Tax=Puia sp. TaxID=2045100 RepID=UPI002F41A964
MKRTRLSAVTCLLLFLIIAWLCIHLDTTPTRVVLSPTESEFSEAYANFHLQEITRAHNGSRIAVPHSTGTAANFAARNYILSTCAALGLDTSIQHTTGISRQRGGVVASNIYNVIARLKGTPGGRTVLITAHYDSQPNAGGSGDDGSGCAAMLETARALKAGRPLRNDVLFLFTDSEEDGLLGAEAFVRENPLVKDIGIMLNFDARGAAGANLLSETNPENGWVIDGYARSGAHHNASSLNYEVYKRLPNNTDYTPFKAIGIAGLNNAFIDGFVHYHSMTDIPRNLDPNTLQEEGDNMLALARYFGNQDIRNTKAPDLTFFNIIGGWFVHYPASLNLVFLVLVNVLLLVSLGIGFTGKQIRLPGMASGFLAFPLMLVLLYFISDWTLAGIRKAVPLYEDYYSNAYHPGSFFLALTGLGIALFTIGYRWLLGRFSLPSLYAGTLFFLVALLDGVYTIMPTAIYFLCLPLLVLLGAAPFTFFRRAPESGSRPTNPSPFLTLILLLPALLLLTPIYYMFYVAFDLQPTSAAVPALTGLLLGMALPLLAAVFRESRWLLPGSAFAVFLLLLTLGLLDNRYTLEQPFKTNLLYAINADEGKARWVSLAPKPDHWNKKLFPNPQYLPTPTVFPGGLYGLSSILTNEAPLENTLAPTLTIRKDTSINGQRLLTLHYEAPGANSVRLTFGSDNRPVDIVFEKDIHSNTPPDNNRQMGYYWLDYKGIPEEGVDFQLRVNARSPFSVDALSRSIGLPVLAGFQGYPPGIIPGPGNYSNVTLVAKRFIFAAP